MSGRKRRLDDIESSLTPTEAAIRWMGEAHEYGSVKELGLAVVGQPDAEAPLYRLRDFVIPGLEKRLKGKPPDERNRRIRGALKDIAFLYYLQLQVNIRVMAETRAWLLTTVLISREWLAENLSPKDIKQGNDGEISWRFGAERFIRELYSFDRAALVIADTYFEGHQVLFPDAAETLQDQIDLTESFIEGDNYNAMNGNGNRRDKTDSINLEQVKDSAQKDAKTLIDEFVVMAKAEALETCGEKRDSVLLVKNHLEAELGKAV